MAPVESTIVVKHHSDDTGLGKDWKTSVWTFWHDQLDDRWPFNKRVQEVADFQDFQKFFQPGRIRLFGLSVTMALLWGGSIFVYGASVPRLGPLGASIGWPLSLAVGLLLANAIGLALGEWRGVSPRARAWMYAGIFVLVVAVILLSRVNS